MKNKLIGAIGAAALTTSFAANAQLPTTDAATLVEIITGNQERSLMHFADQAWEKAKMQFSAESSAKQIDTMNNGFANVVMRTTQTATDLFNLERLKESMPAISACGTATINVMGKDSICNERQAIKASSERHVARHATHGMTPQEQRQVIDYSNKEHFERCRDISDGDLSRNSCSSAAGILGSSGDTLSPEDADATQGFVDLLCGVSPDIRALPRDINNMTPQEISRYNTEQEREAYRSLACESATIIQNQRTSPDPDNYMPSELHRLKAFSNQRWGDSDWIQQMTNTHPTERNSVMETQLLREMVVMDAFQIHLNTIKYEQSLRDYALQAAMISLLKDKL